MAKLDIYEKATGPCEICGKESNGSLYWIGMSQKWWLRVRPYLTHLFNEGMVMKTMFIPFGDKPLCGTTCVGVHHDKVMRCVL